ncbi:MAG: hypothetical protein ACREDK_00195 [Thermoplasmata archaeon]
MSCRNDTGDPHRCDRCGEVLWVADDGWFCGECGVTMPCTMRVVPPVGTTPSISRRSGL